MDIMRFNNVAEWRNVLTFLTVIVCISIFNNYYMNHIMDIMPGEENQLAMFYNVAGRVQELLEQDENGGAIEAFRRSGRGDFSLPLGDLLIMSATVPPGFRRRRYRIFRLHIIRHNPQF